MSVIDAIGSQGGRIARLSVGLGLIGYGATGPGLRRLGLLGLVPAAAGAFDVCLLGPLARRPLLGAKFRATAGPPAALRGLPG